MSGYVKAGASFLKNLLKGGTSSGSGKTIKNIGANVPKSELDKLTRDVKILDQKAKATKAMVDQTNFEIKNPKFSKGKFTFDANRRNVTKKSEKKAKGGRVGLKGGTNLGMQSVKYGLDNNPKITAADPKAKFIAANKKKNKKKVI